MLFLTYIQGDLVCVWVIAVMDCSTGGSGERYGMDFPVCLIVSISSEVNAPVMWGSLSHMYYDGLPITSTVVGRI